MRKMLVLLGTVAMVFGGAAAAHAQPEEGQGPPEDAHKGLCTAYFNGQKDEGADDSEAFGSLEDAAEDDGTNEDLDPEKPIYSDVFEYCQQYGIEGQPEHNGRYDCRDADGEIRDTEPDGEFECILNTGEGDSGGDHPSGNPQAGGPDGNSEG